MSTCVLNASVSGTEGAPPIVFLHGFMGCGTDWDGVASRLEASRRCVAVDLPGHGLSVGLEDVAYSFEGAADAVRATLAALKIHRPMLVGYSMGGRLALFLALRFPDAFSGLVVESGSPGLRSMAQRTARLESDRNVVERLASQPLSEFLEAWYQQGLFRSLADQPALLRKRIEERLRNDPAELIKALQGMGTGLQPSLWKELPGMRVPSLMVAGQTDRKFTGIGRRMAQRCRGARLEIVPGAGHTVHAEQPELFARVVQSLDGPSYRGTDGPMIG